MHNRREGLLTFMVRGWPPKASEAATPAEPSCHLPWKAMPRNWWMWSLDPGSHDHMTKAGEGPVITITISKPPVECITSVAPSCSIPPRLQARGLPRPSVGLPAAGPCMDSRVRPLQTHLLPHRRWAREGSTPGSRDPCRPLRWFALYLWDNC